MVPVVKEGSQLRNISYIANAGIWKASILFLTSVQSSKSNLAKLPKIALWYPRDCQVIESALINYRASQYPMWKEIIPFGFHMARSIEILVKNLGCVLSYPSFLIAPN